MAVTGYTLRNAKYTLFYRLNKQKVPVQLPFMLMTIDDTDQYWVPRSMSGLVSDAGQRLQGSADAVVYLDRNQPLPAGVANGIGCWEYYGA